MPACYCLADLKSSFFLCPPLFFSSPPLLSPFCFSCLAASLSSSSFTFAYQDFEKISEFFKANYKMELTEKDMCVKGWNWGTAKFSGK